MKSNEDLYAEIGRLQHDLRARGDDESAKRLANAMLVVGSSSEVMGALRVELNEIEKRPVFKSDQDVHARVTECLKAINKAFGGWWRG